MDAICRPVALTPRSSDVRTVYGDGVGECHSMMPGHEVVDEVAEVGSIVRDFKIGDQVIIPATTPGWFSVTAQGSYAMRSGVPLGGWEFSNIKDGVFAELVHANDADGNLARLPEGTSLEVGMTFFGMVTIGLHGAELASVEPGDVVAVIGIGPAGLMSVTSVSVLGTSRPFTVGSRPKYIEVAQEFDAINIINYRGGGIVGQVVEATEGQGVNRVIVAGGDLDTFQQVFNTLKVGGRVTNINYLGEGENIEISRESIIVGTDHKYLVSSLTPSGCNRMDRMANLALVGRIRPEKMITYCFIGIEHVEDGVELMYIKPHDLIKPVILV